MSAEDPMDPLQEVVFMEMRYPWLKWREPIRCVVEGEHFLGCRLCIALKGLQAAAPEGKLFQTGAEFQAHMAEVHQVET